MRGSSVIGRFSTSHDPLAEPPGLLEVRVAREHVAGRVASPRPDIVKRRKVAGRPYSRAKLIEIAVDIAAEAMQRRPAHGGSWIAFLTEYRDAGAVKEA
jgi:hypothetical protein